MILFAESTDADALRIRNEFLVDPNLEMSVDTCARKMDIRRPHAAVILEALVADGFLNRKDDGRYVRRPC